MIASDTPPASEAPSGYFSNSDEITTDIQTVDASQIRRLAIDRHTDQISRIQS